MREGRQPHPFGFRTTIPLKTVIAALHFTRMSSVPHLSALPPNFFNFNCLLYAYRELVRFVGDVMISITI